MKKAQGKKEKVSDAIPLLRLLGAGGAAAAASLQPQEVEAGILNVASKALREASDIAKRTEADERGIGGASVKLKKLRVKPARKSRYSFCIAGTNKRNRRFQSTT